MSNERNLEVCQATWDAFGAGDWDRLATYYTEDMTLIFPGQTDVLQGRAAFRAALEGIGALLPPGLEVTAVRNNVGEDEVVSVFEWKSEKVPAGTHSAISFRFNADSQITEERWLVDTEQWKAAF